MNMNHITPKTMSVGARAAALLFVFTVGFALATSGDAWAKRAHSVNTASGPDPTAVTACGTLSGNDTIYHLTADLTETGTGTCITLSGTGSALLLYGYSITGPGAATSTGYGIHITGTRDVVEGFNGTVSGFDIGVLDNGTGTVGDDVNCTANKTGLEESASSTLRWSNFSVYSNTGTGVWINDCGDHCAVVDFATTDNGGDGLLIEGSTGPSADVFIAADNGANGVHVGGTSDDDANTYAIVVDAFLASPNGISDNTAGNGVLLDTSESGANDQVTTVDATGNGNGTTTFDLHDESATCSNNLWYNNTFDTSRAGTVSNPACIGGLGS